MDWVHITNAAEPKPGIAIPRKAARHGSSHVAFCNLTQNEHESGSFLT